MLTLYYAPGTCALASLIALEESGLAFEVKKISLRDGEQRSPDYLKINPKGRVPALITDYGVLTETPAILAYIAQSAPAAKLAPLDDPFEFARLQSFNSYICSTVHVNHAHRPRGSRWADEPAAIEAMKAKVPQNMADCFTLIEQTMFEGPWVMGGLFARRSLPLRHDRLAAVRRGGSRPVRKASDHHARMLQRPAVQRALAYDRA